METTLTQPPATWYQTPIDRRAGHGGELAFNGRRYAGGEFMPFYVPRAVMPQVDEAQYEQLFRFLREVRGVVIAEEQVDPHTLRPHQRVDVNKVRAMAMAPEVLAKPVLASADDYILDGHHRWDGHIIEKIAPMNVYRFTNRSFEEAIADLFAFGGTYSYGDGNIHPESH